MLHFSSSSSSSSRAIPPFSIYPQTHRTYVWKIGWCNVNKPHDFSLRNVPKNLQSKRTHRMFPRRYASSAACGSRSLIFSGTDSDLPEIDMPRLKSSHKRLFQLMGFIGLATAASKLLGLFREMVVAAVFGVGPVVTAFNYSSILPGFFLATLGGVNGPFHVTMATVLSKHTKEECLSLVGKVSTIFGLVGAAMALLLFVFAEPLIDMTAPGLLMLQSGEGMIVRQTAVLQLKIMAPCALFSGLIGIGFGCLSTVGVYGVPALSSSVSSIFIIVAVAMHAVRSWFGVVLPQHVIAGDVSIAVGTMLGALAQWYLQARVQCNEGFGFLNLQWVNLFEDNGVHEVFAIMLPAIVASGMFQIATLTDLWFASYIPGAAAGLGYANLLIMAPLGIVSSSILLPMLSMFVSLSKPTNWLELKERISQGLLLSLAVTLPLSAVMVPLSKPIVEIVFQRVAFDASATALVSSILIWYVVGSTFYLARDLLLRVFYALGDGGVPFQVSTTAIIANVLFDWLLVRVANFGADGLVIATVLVNMASVIVLLIVLSRRLGGLPLRQWIWSFLLFLLSCIISGVATGMAYKGYLGIFSFLRPNWSSKLFSVLMASSFGVLLFYLLLLLVAKTELDLLLKFFKYRLDWK